MRPILDVNSISTYNKTLYYKYSIKTAMKINPFLLILVAIGSSTVWASRHISGSENIQNQEVRDNINTQQIQTNEQKRSGQMTSAQANTINNQESNLNLQQRELTGQVAGNGEIVVNPPATFYSPAQQEQTNLQTSAIDLELNSQQQQTNQPSSTSNPTSDSSRSMTSTNTSDASFYGP